MDKDKLSNIYIATFSSKAEEAALKYGFGLELNDLCISMNLEPDRRASIIDRMKSELKRAGAEGRKTIMHGPFTELTPAAIDSRAIQLMADRYRSTISICQEMGIKDIVVHDGFIPLIYQKPWHLKKSLKFWKSFEEEIPDGFTFYIENVFDDEPDLLSEIIDGVGSSKYKICLDIGHANAMAGEGPGKEFKEDSTPIILDWIERMGERIGHLHLHGNDGSGDFHGDINGGSFRIDEILEGVERFCPPDVTMTIESRNAEPSASYLFQNYGGNNISV